MATALSEDRCPTCGVPRPGAFCAACGERRLDPARDHSLRWLGGELLAGFVQWDSKLARTFATLLARPGRLTRDHLEGRRVRTMTPLQLFLVVSVVFYLFFQRAYAAPIEPMAAAYAAGTPLGNLFHVDVAGAIAAKAAATGQTEAALAARAFDRASQESKVFLGLLIPPVAGVLYLLFRRRNPRLVPHFVAAVHLFTAFLLFDLVYLTVMQLLGFRAIGDWQFAPLLGAYAIHLTLALRRLHDLGWGRSLAAMLVVIAGLVGAILVYRQLVTIAAVHLV